MSRDCFSCANSMNCPHTWECYDDPDGFDENDGYCSGYRPKENGQIFK